MTLCGYADSSKPPMVTIGGSDKPASSQVLQELRCSQKQSDTYQNIICWLNRDKLEREISTLHFSHYFRMAEASIEDSYVVDGQLANIDQASDQVIDRWCENCYDDTKTKIDVNGFCSECNAFLCSNCVAIHKKLMCFLNHTIVRGTQMPKSFAEKPVKYSECNLHNDKVNDRYCLDHHKMMCSECLTQDHRICNVQTISSLCKDIRTYDIKRFQMVVDEIKTNLINTSSDLKDNATYLIEEKSILIKEAERTRDMMISKANDLFDKSVSIITKQCEERRSEINTTVSTLAEEIEYLQENIDNLNKTLSTKFDQNMFIRMQQIVNNTQKCKRDIDYLVSRSNKSEFTFDSSKCMNNILNCESLGTVKEILTPIDSNKGVEELVFPLCSFIRGRQLPCTETVDIDRIRAKKMSPLMINTADDIATPKINGIVATDNDILIVSDWNNKALKVFSADKLLSRVKLSTGCYGVTVTEDKVAIVSTPDKKLHFLDISEPSSVSIQKSLSLNYWVQGITSYNGKLVVTRFDKPRSVKLINMDGQEVWSVSKGPDGQQLFAKPYDVVVQTIDGKDTVIVSDWGRESLTLLGASNGELLKVVDTKGKDPHGMTVDKFGNILVCYRMSSKVRVYSSDFTKIVILLTKNDIHTKPSDLAYNRSTCTLFVGYNNKEIDRFKISLAARTQDSPL